MKHRLYEEVSRLTKALASPRRLELLEVLAQGERSVEAVAGQTGLSVANASQHLQVLREARLVEGRKQGLFVHYRLAGDDVADLLTKLTRVAERRLAEVDRLIREYRDTGEDFEPVGQHELLARVRSGTVVVLDVRPEEEYRAGHIPGALSVPLARLSRRLKAIPCRAEIVAYCRGPFCLLADEAVRLLRARGRRARRLQDGLPEWRAAGLPIEVEDHHA